jgi:hypothetical protein
MSARSKTKLLGLPDSKPFTHEIEPQISVLLRRQGEVVTHEHFMGETQLQALVGVIIVVRFALVDPYLLGHR